MSDTSHGEHGGHEVRDLLWMALQPDCISREEFACDLESLPPDEPYVFEALRGLGDRREKSEIREPRS